MTMLANVQLVADLVLHQGAPALESTTLVEKTNGKCISNITLTSDEHPGLTFGEGDLRTNASFEAKKRDDPNKAFEEFVEQYTEQNHVDEIGSFTASSRLPPETSESRKIIHKARDYQQELFERAKFENIIAVLDTGSGKTLIACLLVKWMLTKEKLARASGQQRKTILFLANSVHLVQQQAHVLENNLPEKTIVLHGKGKLNLSQRAVWENLLDQYSLIICTAAVLDQCLMRAYLNMSQISLLIFDEAHHAKKDHAYGRLMKSYYLNCHPELRPKIFGMTASPIDSKRSIQETATALETILHAKIVTTDDTSLLAFAPKPKVEKWVYPKLPLDFETDLYHQISSLVRFCDDLKRGFEFSKKAAAQLGPWCADYTWKYVISTSSHESSNLRRKFEKSPAYAAIPTFEGRQQALDKIDQAVFMIRSHDFGHPVAELSHLSPKVIFLYEQLLEHYQKQPDTRAIVFVDERLRALVLHDLFVKLKIANVRPGILLGIAGSNDYCSVRNQEQMLQRFRTGQINVIFATAVADEGLDIPQCNLCIRFDLCTTTIQYMQSRGRARKKGSIFAHMIEEDNVKHEDEVDFQVAEEQYIKQWCSSLPPDRKLNHQTSLMKLIAKDSANKSFKTVTGAVCDFRNSLLIVSRFAASLRHTGITDLEIYDEEIDIQCNRFRYTVRLPPNSDSKVKGCKGEWRGNKQSAKRSAAFGCCMLLRRREELDDDLNSVFKKFKPENLNARLAVSTNESSYAMKVKPTVWDNGLGTLPAELQAIIIKFNSTKQLKHPVAPLVLLTRHRLLKIPSFTVYLERIPTSVEFVEISRALPVSNDELLALTAFTLNGVFQDVFNKQYAQEPEFLTYWLAPLLPRLIAEDVNKLADLVDFEAINTTQRDRTTWSEDQLHQNWTNKFLCDPLNGKFHYLAAEVVSNMTIFDAVPSTVPKIAEKSRESIIEFSDSTWKRSKGKAQTESKYDINQPVLSADLIGVQRNFLDPLVDSDFVPCLIAPQTLQVGRISPQVAASCLAWPAIIHRIEAYMISQEAFERLGIRDVAAELTLEAVTKNADEHDEGHQLHSNGRRGMGKNYERLEFIGDSLLKMMTTITIFIQTKCDEEGMHCRRMGIICNKHLFDNATEQFELHKYTRSLAFNRNTWYPENLVLLKGRGAQENPSRVKHAELTHSLSMKTIADVAEAMIGAAVISSALLPLEHKFDLGIQVITKLVQSEDHNISHWSDLRKLYQPPAWSLVTNDPLANDLADKVYAKTKYLFRYPSLLRSAFTHSSDTNSPVPNLQRLEFLGDAVLDWVCLSWLFDTNPTRNPQWLTEHKMAMVSNKFLACLAVVLDFDKYLFVTSVDLFGSITTYASKVRDMLVRAPPGSDDYCADFWVNIDGPPKALSDLVESYLGAVLVDSDWSFSEIQLFFEAHVKPFFVDIEAYDTFANRHPTTYVHKKLGEEFKCQDFCFKERDLRAEGKTGEVEIIVGIVVHGQVVASSTGSSAKYARIRASKGLVKKLEGMTVEGYRQEWGCTCQGGSKEACRTDGARPSHGG